MKQIIAIIRDERVEETKTALETIGVRGVTFLYVTGRGQQKGTVSARELGGALNRNLRMQLTSAEGANAQAGSGEEIPGDLFPLEKEFVLGFLPKRMLVIIAYDDDVRSIVQAIVNVNQTGRHGDGRIFICPMISAIRVRTGEQGDKALS
ncbi:P-II family nitrogen regulator [Methanoregula sp.]|jgi:nitrogen regulatory protein PII 2|uniref:P-II family nitrogen regulator n=1 Tax=Methanoregula sp. TaxID=2052170 RepID=UPI003C27F497